MIIDTPRPCHIPALRGLWKQAFGDTDEFLDDFFGVAFSPNRCRCIFMGDRIAAVLYWFDCSWEDKPIAYLYAVATDTAFRGQGLCRMLMENTHSHLRQLGYQGCILVPGSRELFEMYEKLGYSACSYVREFDCAAGSPIPLRQLSAEEYAALRRQYLSDGGVVQEQETLRLLRAQASFYAGENCLLVCAVSEGKLSVSELLGDPNTAPGILAALGFSEGKFRTPGKEKPFAMYHAFTDNQAMPSYFGLAMD